MRHHHLSFIGSSTYQSVRYTMAGRPAKETSYMEVALAELLALDPEHDAVTVFVTSKKDVQANWNGLRTAMERRGWLLGATLHAREFAPPQTPGELHQALASIARQAFSGDPTSISLDITHGFRSFATLGVKALEVEQADRQRAGRSPVPIRVYYGALEEVADPRESPVPIWDLSEISVATAWSEALSDFELHGRADRFHKLSQSSGQQSAVESPHIAYLHHLGNALHALANDLCFLRRDVHRDSAGKLHHLLADAAKRSALEQALPMLTEPLARATEFTLVLLADDRLGPGGPRHVCALLEFYRRVDRFAEAYVVLSESIGILFNPQKARQLALEGMAEADAITQLRDDIPVFGASTSSEGRSRRPAFAGEAVYRMAQAGRPRAVVDLEVEVTKLASAIFDARNDFLHWAVRKHTLSAAALRQKMTDFIERYRACTAAAEQCQNAAASTSEGENA